MIRRRRIKMENCKVMVVGDWSTGRTCLNIAFGYGEFPTNYIPTVCDVALKTITMKDPDHKVVVAAWEDGSSGEDYDRLRPLSYPQTDVFIALFSVASKKSLKNIKNRWIPEVRSFCPKTPIVIVGNKIDLRKTEQKTISTKEGFKMARKMGTSYFEVSCLQLKGIDECFRHAVEIAELNTKQMRRKLRRSSIIIPPLKPFPDPEPVIEAAPSTFVVDWQRMISVPKFHDVKFILDEGIPILAHKLLLSSTSSVFQKLFMAENFSGDNLKFNKIQGISKVYDTEEGRETTVVLSKDIKADVFDRILQFIYTGVLSGTLHGIDVANLKCTAQILGLEQLDSHCDKMLTNDDDVSIMDFSDDQKFSAMKNLYDQQVFSDMVFNVEGTRIPCHKVVMFARSPDMAALMDAGNDLEENVFEEVQITDASVENFTILLEYLYTDSADLDNASDLFGLMALADRSSVHQLAALCEVKLKTLEGLCEGEQENAIELLRKYKACKATRITEWYRHHISHNFHLFSDQKEFSNLDPDDKEYILDHLWPPLSYELELEQFNRDVLNVDSGQTKRRRLCVIL